MSTVTYPAAVLCSPRTVRLRQRPLSPLLPGEVLLRTRRVGICGTDLAIFSGGYKVPLPLVLGHEIVASVEDVGPGVTGWEPGTRVVPEINAGCAAWGRALCPTCAAGLESHCPTRTTLGITRHDGGLAQFCRVPAGCLHRVPEGLSDERAVFTEPLAAALQTFVMAGDPAGQRVLVVGAGRLGALVVAVAVQQGARVAVLEVSRLAGERALKMGAERVIPAGKGAPGVGGDVRAAVLDWSAGLGADVVVECTGLPGLANQALNWVRPRGTLAIKSTPGPAAPLDLTRLVVDEVRLQGSRCGPFPQALAWLQQSSLPLEDLVEDTFPLEKTAEALDAAGWVAKAVVVMEQGGANAL